MPRVHAAEDHEDGEQRDRHNGVHEAVHFAAVWYPPLAGTHPCRPNATVRLVGSDSLF
jgi:hypothetical protein